MQKPIITILAALFLLLPGIASANLSIKTAVTNGTCQSNASITATVTGNTGTVYYQLETGSGVVRSYQSSNVFLNVPAGTYFVRVQDGGNFQTQLSTAVLASTTYKPMQALVTNGTVSCINATLGTLQVQVTGGKGPFQYAIIAGPVLRAPQASNIFNNLPLGSYTISVSDACNTTVANDASITLGTTATITSIVPQNGALITWKGYNCASTTLLSMNYRWTYKSNYGAALTGFDNTHFFWRYIYPSGSNNMYGANGVLNGQKITVGNTSVNMPATAQFPFDKGDLVLYNECGDSVIFPKTISYAPATAALFPGSTCESGGFIQTYAHGETLICLPIVWTFTETVTGQVRRDTTLTNNLNPVFYGFAPGKKYLVSCRDASGNAVSINTQSVQVPVSPGNIAYNGYFTNYDMLHAGFPTMSFPYNLVSPVNSYSYVVKASSSGNPAIGYTSGHSLRDGTKFGSSGGGYIYGPNADGSWPDGAYTVTVTVGCFTRDISFTIGSATTPTLNASINSYQTSPVCGGFNLRFNATLDYPSLYVLKIMPGSTGNVGATQNFGSTTSPGTYYSGSFDGLDFGTYTIALVTTGSSGGTGGKPLISSVINYQSGNTLTINTLNTGGYICPGSTDGTLVIDASSATGYALKYSIDNGLHFQDSSHFSGLAAGSYDIMVKDACGNTVTYKASVLQSPDIKASAASGQSMSQC